MFAYVLDILSKKKKRKKRIHCTRIFKQLELTQVENSIDAYRNIVEKSFTRHVYLKILIIHDYNFFLSRKLKGFQLYLTLETTFRTK